MTEVFSGRLPHPVKDAYIDLPIASTRHSLPTSGQITCPRGVSVLVADVFHETGYVPSPISLDHRETLEGLWLVVRRAVQAFNRSLAWPKSLRRGWGWSSAALGSGREWLEHDGPL
jgi:hypothetical protein